MKKSILFSLFIACCFLTTNAQYTEILAFGGATGGNPNGSLISDSVFLYGMTGSGGTSGDGVIFKIKPDGTSYTKLLDFNGAANGRAPAGSLISDGIYLYGMTLHGGTNDNGVLFRIKPDGTGYLKLMTFTGPNGRNPNATLIYDGTYLYGMTLYGGISDSGIVFKIKPDGTGYSKLLDLSGVANGSWPPGSLFFDSTFLYGMTSGGGANHLGTIFKTMPDGTGYSKLLDFAGAANGSAPIGTLISDGIFLYGTTFNGGENDLGTIFKIKPDGTGYSKLLDFTGEANGQYPTSDLIFDGAFLYGMTTYGGTAGWGILFKIKPDGSEYSKLLDFVSVNTSNPFGSLISDGTFLYGMTSLGGTNNQGVIFKYSLATGIAEMNSAMGCNMYPNPNNGQFTIIMNGQQGITKLEIYNMLGQKIYSTTSSTQEISYDIDISHTPKGMYSVKIYEGVKVYSETMVIE